ncbi:hypothetical protein PR202_gb20475 [Eleusine coracana subsp. coracana]|uniref:Exocyst subunit Exo70 family protein n=1 Tax=Eleusine coracana subsp. coracana TaxID=191504 RepID=A0AAV5F8M2_ELECO|nr:hypothetical protein PR202_gb20475 [Eleusine coracana subsp. coracana]
MSTAPRRVAGVRPRHRLTAGGRREVMGPRHPPVGQDPDEVLGDVCVHAGWFAAASCGDLEVRVHGGRPVGSISRLFIGYSSLQPMPELSSKEASISLLDSIEKLLDPLARDLFPDDTHRRNKYMASARQLIQLRLQQQLQPDLASKEIHDRVDSLLNQAMSSLAMEFCQLRIWRLDARGGLGISPASIWESISRGCGSGSGSTASWPSSSSGSFTATSGSSNDDSFNMYQSALSLCEDISVRSRKSSSHASFIDFKSLSVLDVIAGVIIKGGYEHMLRRAMDRHSTQLASYVEILDVDNILVGHMEEPKEILLRVWTSAMHAIVGLLREMQRQLNGLNFGSFNIFKEDYFLAIAKVSVMKLFKLVSSICIQEIPQLGRSSKETYEMIKFDMSKMVIVVMLCQALNYIMPTILALFSGQIKESILVEGERLSHGLSDMFAKLFVEINDLTRSQCLAITDIGVHRATRHIMNHMRLLVQQKNTVHLILKGGFNVFGGMVVELVSSLEFMLDMNSRSLRLQGQQEMFLLNNVHFMLQEAKKNTDLVVILGEAWLLQHHDLVNRLISGYVDASWGPVVSSFERRTRVPVILWPHQLFDKFSSSFEMTYSVQKSWKVTDPLIRKMVREAVCRKVIPLYQMHMENYSNKKMSMRYNSEQLESQLLELFEG